MPTRNPRLLVTLDPSLYQFVKRIADMHGISMSLALRDIVKKMYQEELWYWSPSWQKGEREADRDLAKGRFEDFDSVEALLNDLN